MSKLAEAYVEISANSRPLTQELGSVKSRLAAFARDMKGALTIPIAIAGAASVAAATSYLTEAVGKAASLGETLSKVEIVFGESAQTLIDKAQELSDKFGLVRQTSLDAGANIGLIAQASGLSAKASADLATQFVQLAADASSFFEVPMADALEKIRSALVGESEPIRSFGVLLSEAAVQAEALRLGLTRSTSSMSEAVKVQARASLIIKGLSSATGNLELTQSSTSNQTKKLSGQFEELQTKIGEKLIPVANDLISILSNLAGALNTSFDSAPVEAMIDNVTNLAKVIRALTGDLGALREMSDNRPAAGGFGRAAVSSLPGGFLINRITDEVAFHNKSMQGMAADVGGDKPAAPAPAEKPADPAPAKPLDDKELIAKNRQVLSDFARRFAEMPIDGIFMQRRGQPTARVGRDDAEGLERRGVPLLRANGSVSLGGAMGSVLRGFGGIFGELMDAGAAFAPERKKKRFESVRYSDSVSAFQSIQTDMFNAMLEKEKDKKQTQLVDFVREIRDLLNGRSRGESTAVGGD